MNLMKPLNTSKYDVSLSETSTIVSLEDHLGILANFIPQEDRSDVIKHIRNTSEFEKLNTNKRIRFTSEDFSTDIDIPEYPNEPHKKSTTIFLDQQPKTSFIPADPGAKRKYLIALVIMMICGSSSDFLGKIIYAQFPAHENEADYLRHTWGPYVLTFGAVTVDMFGMWTGRNTFKYINKQIFYEMFWPALFTLLVTGGRYCSLIFLPPAIVTMLKNGMQLVLLAFYRKWKGKHFTGKQWSGVVLVVFGICLGSIQDALISDRSSTDQIKGFSIMLVVGVAGTLKNIKNQALMRNHVELESDFVVGFEAFQGFLLMIICGLILIFTPANSMNSNHFTQNVWKYMKNLVLMILFLIFVIFVFLRDSRQMLITKMSSAMTRKLFQQFYPMLAFIESIITYYFIKTHYGEKFDLTFTWLLFGGFICTLVGTYMYIKAPKKTNASEKLIN